MFLCLLYQVVDTTNSKRIISESVFPFGFKPIKRRSYGSNTTKPPSDFLLYVWLYKSDQ